MNTTTYYFYYDNNGNLTSSSTKPTNATKLLDVNDIDQALYDAGMLVNYSDANGVTPPTGWPEKKATYGFKGSPFHKNHQMVWAQNVNCEIDPAWIAINDNTSED